MCSSTSWAASRSARPPGTCRWCIALASSLRRSRRAQLARRLRRDRPHRRGAAGRLRRGAAARGAEAGLQAGGRPARERAAQAAWSGIEVIGRRPRERGARGGAQSALAELSASAGARTRTVLIALSAICSTSNSIGADLHHAVPGVGDGLQVLEQQAVQRLRPIRSAAATAARGSARAAWRWR